MIDGPGGDDASLRPNQVLAISLSPDLVSKPQARRVLAAVRRHLLTPYGLRTLSPEDPTYIGVYKGDRNRDGAYHQGTVWPWLLGPYFDAVRAVEGEEAARADLIRILPALRAHLADAGLGNISEIFDGDPPHEPKGCISQAWSVAEVLRQVWGTSLLSNFAYLLIVTRNTMAPRHRVPCTPLSNLLNRSLTGLAPRLHLQRSLHSQLICRSRCPHRPRACKVKEPCAGGCECPSPAR